MQILKKYQWELADLCAGILLALAFAPFEFSFFAIIALVILFASWHEVSPRRAALRGYLFGIGLFGVGVSWVFVSIYQFGGANIIVAVLITSLFCGFWAIFPAISGYLSVKFFGYRGGNSLLVYPIIWVLIEYIRGAWVLNGFPWLQLAYSQMDMIYAGYLPVIGVYGAGFIVALSAMIITVIVRRKCFDKGLVLGLVGLALVGYFLKPIQWTDAIGDPIKVSVIQGNISQDRKWQPEFKSKTLELYRELTFQHWDSQVIIWPETAVPALLHEVDEYYLQPLHQQARKHNTDLVVSLPVKDSERGRYFNAVLALGESRSIYKKIHLLPFGEYMPFQPLSGWVLDSLKILPVGSFTPGAKDQPLLEAGGYPFITTICYEDVFAEVDATRLAKAAYLVNVTNDGWFGNSIEPYQHMQIARMRALESGRYLIRATNTGLTGIVGPDGVLLHQLPLFKTKVLTAEIVPMGGLTPITKIGESKVIYLLVFILLAMFLKNSIQKKSVRH